MRHFVNSYLKEFLSHISASHSASSHTEDAYAFDVEQFLEFIEDQDLKHIPVELAYSYVNQLYELGLSSSSVARKISALRSFFRFLQVNYGVATNPFSTLKIRQQSRSLPKYLMFEELRGLLDSCEANDLGFRNRVLMEVMYACGLRVHEASELKLSNFNFDERSIRIVGKGDKERLLFYYGALSGRLNQYLSGSRFNLLQGKEHDYLFVNSKGDPLSVRGIQYLLEKQGEVCGLRQKLHPHMLRHSFATHLLDNGASLRIVQTLLGHESLSTTQIYTHVSLSKIKKVYQEAMEKMPLT